jgi:integrase
VSSVWIDKRATSRGAKRYRVRYRLGGSESPALYGGTFQRQEDALKRKAWLIGEIASVRVPDLRLLQAEGKAPTLAEAAVSWRGSRVDVAEQTSAMYRSAFARIFKTRPGLRCRRVDELSVADVADLISALTEAGYKRETIRKTRTALAQTLDFYTVDPNPVRDERVKLPRERRTHIPPPLGSHIERVAGLLAPRYVLPLLVIDECGPRVSELATAVVGDLDEERRAIRVRPEAEKNERYRYLHLPRDLYHAITAGLPPREDRDLTAPLFPGLDEAALRTAIGRACKLAGVPHFSPHGLRRRRGSLHYKRTGSLAEVAELLGDSKRVAADHYVYALVDYAEVDRRPALRRLCA